DGTTGVEGGCIYPNADHRVFAYDQSDAASKYYTMEIRIQSHLDGPFNFVFGVNHYHNKSYGDYYVLANTLDMLTTYGGSYPGYFDNTTSPNSQDLSYGTAAFGEVYYDLMPNLKLTIGLRMNKDDKETHDTSVLFNAGRSSYAPATVHNGWTRVPTLLSGTDPAVGSDEYALAELYAPNLLQAALGTPAGSPERLAVNAAVPVVPQPGETRYLTGSPTKAEWKKPSGRIGLNWQVNDTSMVYAFLSRGYKPGGFNPAIPPAFQSSSKFTFDPESINAFEIGSKNMFLDGGLMLNGDVFFYDYKGLQVTRIAHNSSINDNINARIYGAELESVWHPETVPALAVNFSYSFLHARVKGSQSVDPVNRTGGNSDWVLLENIDPGSQTGINYVAKKSELTAGVIAAGEGAGAILPIPGTIDANGIPVYESRTFLGLAGVTTSDGLPVSLDGNKLPNSPDSSFHLGVAYTWDIARIAGSVTARWDYYWQSSMYAREFNTQGDYIDSWDQHNASITYNSTDGHWTAKLWARNINDSNNITGKYLTSDTSGFYRNYFLTEPLISGISVQYHFGQQ
ncbi:MAG TPA: TonB-dependent receptor, partial [Pseudomonadales bacterium]|nr:TonB-dependent receptor [Pseudomonadales bacterium]